MSDPSSKDGVQQNNDTLVFCSLLDKTKQEKMKTLAHKASQTFPPCFTNEPQLENILELECTSIEEKELSAKALEKGRNVMKSRSFAPFDSGSTGIIPPGYPLMDDIDFELGGIDGFIILFSCHYIGMFSNPRMKVLFDTRREEDSKSSAMDHGKRIACTLLDLWYGTNHFSSLGRGSNGAFAVAGTHRQAKNCPTRPLSQQTPLPKGSPRASKRFTVNQRDSWVGHICLAAEECETSKEFQTKFGWWLATAVSAYAPFYDEETGELDWMEESPYDTHI